MSKAAFRLSKLAELSGGSFDGDDVEISGAGGPAEAMEGDITFLRADTPLSILDSSQAGAVILHASHPEVDRPCVRHENPRFAFTVALSLLKPEQVPQPGTHPTAVVHETANVDPTSSIGPLAVVEAGASIGGHCVIGPHSVIGENATIGKNCRIEAHVVVSRDCVLGDGVSLFAGSIIGADGFGFEVHNEAVHRMEHLGNVVIGDGVEIGANSCVDRGTTGSTRIGSNSKFDNLVQVGHNCDIGDSNLVCGQVAFGGSSTTGDRCFIGGDSSLADHSDVGNDVMLAAKSGVHGRVPDKSVWSGTPAHDHDVWLREVFALPKLPKLLKEFRELKRRISEIDASAEGDKD